MRKRLAHLRKCIAPALLLATGLLIATTASSQEGHPLTGTWSGDWGTGASDRTPITVVLNWDGEAITGILNPGPNMAALNDIGLDPSSWEVRIQLPAGSFGPGGAVTAIGKLEDLGSVHRTITGTWQRGAESGDFRLVRD